MKQKKNQTNLEQKQEQKKKVEKVVLKEWHSTEYIKKLKETTYKNKEVVFILPNGKEYRDDK